jgi:hypothetical protein
MKTMMTLLILFHAHAQQISEDPARHSFDKEGQVFVLKIVPGEKRLDIRLVDAPLVTLTPSRVTVTAQVTDYGQKKENVKLEQKANEIRLTEPLVPDKVYEFTIKDKMTKKSEVIRLEPKP